MYDEDDPLAIADPESIAAAVVRQRRKSVSKNRTAAEKAVALMMRGVKTSGRRGSDIALGGESGGALGGTVAKRALMQASARASERIKIKKHREVAEEEHKRQ